jgi:hypothetical protein
VENGIFKILSEMIKHCACVCVCVCDAVTSKASKALFVTGKAGKLDLETNTAGRRSGPTCLTEPSVALR